MYQSHSWPRSGWGVGAAKLRFLTRLSVGAGATYRLFLLQPIQFSYHLLWSVFYSPWFLNFISAKIPLIVQFTHLLPTCLPSSLSYHLHLMLLFMIILASFCYFLFVSSVLWVTSVHYSFFPFFLPSFRSFLCVWFHFLFSFVGSLAEVFYYSTGCFRIYSIHVELTTVYFKVIIYYFTYSKRIFYHISVLLLGPLCYCYHIFCLCVLWTA